MATTSVFTVPNLFTFESNGIKDLSFLSNCPQENRILYLNGSLVRIEINPSLKTVNLQLEDDTVDLSSYTALFEKLMNNFFYGKAYLFGFVDENKKLLIYDIYTNDNYLSLRDMKYLNINYDLNICEPIYSGKISYEDAITIIHKKLSEGLDINKIYILPSVYVNDKTNYSDVIKYSEKVLIGKKPEPPKVWDGTENKTESYKKLPETSQDITETLLDVDELVEEYDLRAKVLKITTKEERTSIYNETYKNVSKYVEKNKDNISVPALRFWEKHGKTLSYLYAIYTLPTTRKILYEYCEEVSYGCYNYFRENETEASWAQIIIELFEEFWHKQLKFKFHYTDYKLFAEIFKEELKELNMFYSKESDFKNDWRYNDAYLV